MIDILSCEEQWGCRMTVKKKEKKKENMHVPAGLWLNKLGFDGSDVIFGFDFWFLFLHVCSSEDQWISNLL